MDPGIRMVPDVPGSGITSGTGLAYVNPDNKPEHTLTQAPGEPA